LNLQTNNKKKAQATQASKLKIMRRLKEFEPLQIGNCLNSNNNNKKEV
jgi:hypothetical protein